MQPQNINNLQPEPKKSFWDQLSSFWTNLFNKKDQQTSAPGSVYTHPIAPSTSFSDAPQPSVQPPSSVPAENAPSFAEPFPPTSVTEQSNSVSDGFNSGAVPEAVPMTNDQVSSAEEVAVNQALDSLNVQPFSPAAPVEQPVQTVSAAPAPIPVPEYSQPTPQVEQSVVVPPSDPMVTPVQQQPAPSVTMQGPPVQPPVAAMPTGQAAPSSFEPTQAPSPDQRPPIAPPTR